LKPYWGKPAVRNFREGDGNNGIIEARSAPSPYSTGIPQGTKSADAKKEKSWILILPLPVPCSPPGSG